MPIIPGMIPVHPKCPGEPLVRGRGPVNCNFCDPAYHSGFRAQMQTPLKCQAPSGTALLWAKDLVEIFEALDPKRTSVA